MGWSGVKNGRLLALCIENEFEIIVSIDKNLQHQQNLDKFPISIVIFDSYSSKIEDLKKYLPAFNSNIVNYKKHAAYVLTSKDIS